MLTVLPSVLDPGELVQVRTILSGATYVDGAASAGSRAATVKKNSELPLNAAESDALNRIVMGNLVAHPLYRQAALPLRVAAPFYARYAPGMRYGRHIDDPVMGSGPRYRSDISITVFLNDPDDYGGGELRIETEFGDKTVKLPAGDAVMYPSSSLHEVCPVLSGERLVAVTWVQSMVRSPEQRRLLYELARARERLFSEAPEGESTREVDHVYVNLVRMWSEI